MPSPGAGALCWHPVLPHMHMHAHTSVYTHTHVCAHIHTCSSPSPLQNHLLCWFHLPTHARAHTRVRAPPCTAMYTRAHTQKPLRSPEPLASAPFSHWEARQAGRRLPRALRPTGTLRRGERVSGPMTATQRTKHTEKQVALGTRSRQRTRTPVHGALRLIPPGQHPLGPACPVATRGAGPALEEAGLDQSSSATGGNELSSVKRNAEPQRP